MLEIKVQDTLYQIIDSIEKITIADSFVVPPNKIGGGNGEAKLYVGQNDEALKRFFGERGFIVNCFLLKADIKQYLTDIKSEYLEPAQEYREKNNMPQLWSERQKEIDGFSDIITFKLFDQNQIAGPRVYVNSDDGGYKLIREFSLPIISYLNIYKIKHSGKNEIKYYLQLKYNDPDSSVETETGNENIEIKSPFDPNKIKVRTAPSTIGQIIDDLEDKIINLDTEFQRLPNLWDDRKKSRFIESLLLRLPIPAFYFNEKEENNLEVIDGLQRISTIRSFAIEKKLVLQDLEFLKKYNACTYDTLPSLFSRRIKTFPITTYIIEKGTPNEVKYNIFKRVNTGGLVLTPQEIRHAINQGVASDLVADLVRNEDALDENGKIIKRKDKGVITELKATSEGIAFVKATDNRIGSFRMEDRDFATRFVSFYLIPYQEYEPDLDTFLNKGMAKIKDHSISEIAQLKDNFRKAMELAFDMFGNDAFRKRFNGEDSRKPINKALFEALSVNFAKLSDGQRNDLKQKKESFKKKLMQLHNEEGGKFLRAITQGTAQKESVELRFREVEEIIKASIQYD